MIPLIVIIIMGIVGLFALVSGRLVGKNYAHLNAKIVRITGLILLIPSLFIVFSIILLLIAGYSIEDINSESLQSEILAPNQTLWIYSLAIALANVNYHSVVNEERERSGCLVWWLAYTCYLPFIILYTIYAVPNFPSWAFGAYLTIFLATLFFCFAIWRWSKWGVYGYIIATFVLLGMSIATMGFHIASFLVLGNILVIWLLIKPKWQFFH